MIRIPHPFLDWRARLRKLLCRYNRMVTTTGVGVILLTGHVASCFAQTVLAKAAPESVALQRLLDKAIQQQLNAIPNKPVEQPPSIDILDPQDTIELSDSQVHLSYEIKTSLSPVRIALFVDGERVPIDDSQQPKGDDKDILGNLSFDIPEHDVLIGLVAENALGSGKRAQLHVRWVGTDSPKPNLYLLAVGVKDYAPEFQQNPPLQFPVSDATEFTNVMKAQEGGGFYKHVYTKLLPDAEADRNGIIEGLAWLKENATNKDVAMVFMSGHGASRGGSGYDYLPFGANKSKEATTFLHDFEIKNYLSEVTAKIVAFIDTCHSGKFFETPGAKGPSSSIQEFAEDLARSSSFTVIFSSSTGKELSIEKDEWKHGAFTKALIEGLEGNAANAKGVISLARLNDYIADRVKELTAGQQHPMYIAPTANTNPAIAVKVASVGVSK